MEAVADIYTIPQEHLDFRDTIRQIAQERVAPRAAEIDEKAEYPQDIRELFAEHDLFGLPFETEYGGTGTGTLMLNMAIEEVAKVCASSALMLMVQELGTLPIRCSAPRSRSSASCRGAPRASGRPAFALSEPEAGSDPGGMITRAERDGDEWVINGTKNWITNLGIADFYVVFAVTDKDAGHSRGISAFVVEADRPGFSVGKLEHKLGIRGLAHRPADLRRRPRAGRQPARDRGRGVQGRDGHARPLAPRRRGPGPRDRAGRDRLRRRLREGAQAVRQADRRVPGDPVQARRHGDPVRGRPRAALPGVREGRPRRAATWASTPRWPSSSARTLQWP